jgi:predicted PurR-regulated permease PerM
LNKGGTRIPKVASHRRKKRGWLKSLLLFIFVPLIIWGLAFIGWFYWDSIANLIGSENQSSKGKPARPFEAPRREIEKRAKENQPPAQEKIIDEDRKKLDEILRQRG